MSLLITGEIRFDIITFISTNLKFNITYYMIIGLA